MVLTPTMEPKKCDVLVVDTAGFIKSARLEDIGDQECNQISILTY